MNKIHHGRNVKRFREMLGIKQEGLAYQLGEDWNQKKISALEQKEVIDESLLEEVAKLLKVPAEAIKNFDEETAINIISNTVNNNDNANGNSLFNYYPTFNPIDKLVETIDKNEKLYERLLQVEREKNVLLQKWIDSQK